MTTDDSVRGPAADLLEEVGRTEEASYLRNETVGQRTTEGTEIVTVARDGADHDKHGNGIYTSAIYVAVRRKSDGVLTWRRNGGYYADRTSGKGITAPMIQRAKNRAEDRGVEFVEYVRHGMICK